MTLKPATYPRHRFPAEIISHAVWLYHVFSLSLRDVELILAERGIVVTHESIRHWCLKFGSDFARKLRRRRPQPGDTWHLDEVFIRIRGVLHYLWRAVDQHGVVVDILVQDRRNGTAASVSSSGLQHKPRRLVADGPRSYVRERALEFAPVPKSAEQIPHGFARVRVQNLVLHKEIGSLGEFLRLPESTRQPFPELV